LLKHTGLLVWQTTTVNMVAFIQKETIMPLADYLYEVQFGKTIIDRQISPRSGITKTNVAVRLIT
jgi:hypothetical protein